MDEARSTAETHHSRVRAGIQNMVTGAKNPTSSKRPHHSALASRKKPTQTHPYRCHPRKRLYRARYYHAELGTVYFARSGRLRRWHESLSSVFCAWAQTDPQGLRKVCCGHLGKTTFRNKNLHLVYMLGSQRRSGIKPLTEAFPVSGTSMCSSGQRRILRQWTSH